MLFVSWIKDCKIKVILMPKNVITLMDNQHVKRSKTLHESARQFFCNISWSLWNEISSKSSVFVVSVILRLFVNILAPDSKYSVSVKASVWWDEFGCTYRQIKNYFLNFLQHFRNFHQISNTFKQKMSLGGYLFLKL